MISTVCRRFSAQCRRFSQMQEIGQMNLAPGVIKMERTGRETFKGPVRACILDWSGTTADAHVLAPAVVFVEVFEKHGVPISMAEARLPMGLRKDLHIGKILEIEEVR